MPNNQSKQLVHGAMMIAIFAMLIAIGYFIPPIAIIILLFSPLPIAWYSATYERSKSALVTLVGIVITTFYGGLLILPASIIFGLAGFVIGDAIRLKKSKLYLLISTSITFLFTTAIMYLAFLKLFEIDFIRKSLDSLKKTYINALEMSEKMTNQPPIITKKELNEVFDMLNTIIPAAVTLTCVLLALIVIVINLPLLKRFKIDVPKFAEFNSMRLPKAVLWYYLITLVISLFIKPEAGTALYVITLNFSIVLWMLLTLQGVSFLFFIIKERELPKFLKILAVFFSIPFYSLVVLIGVLDLGFDIRNYVTTKKKL